MKTKKQIKELSNCCKAPLITHSSDEGTGYYECSACHWSCDVLSTPKPSAVKRGVKEIQKGCKCHCHFGGDYKECTKVKGHPVVTCEHCTPPQELPEQDAVCTEHGREGCSHKFPQEPVLLFECEDCKQWVRAKVVTFIDGKYSIENHECVLPQEPQEQECDCHNSQ
jgi:hypothetical protein